MERLIRGADWLTVGLLVVMYALLIGNAIWYFSAPSHILIHIGIGALAIHLAFTIWHEAMHLTVSSKLWVNNTVGIIGMFPYMTPFFMQKWVHLRHHSHLNEPDDPNLIYTDGSFLTLPLRYPRALRYARQVLARDPRNRPEKIADAVFLAGVLAVYVGAFFAGILIDVLLIWFVPVVIAKLAMDWYINYVPHVGLPPDRFRGTRVLDMGWLTWVVLAHNYHAIHHLWPSIPWHSYRETFREKLGYLKENGVPIEHRLSHPSRPVLASD